MPSDETSDLFGGDGGSLERPKRQAAHTLLQAYATPSDKQNTKH